MVSPFASALVWTVALACISAQTPVSVAPNVAETLQYLNGAKPRLYTYGGDGQQSKPLALSADRTRLILHSQDPEGQQTLDGEVDILELDPMSVSVEHNDAISDVVQIACATKRNCYTIAGHTQGLNPSFDRSDHYYFWMTPDGDKADRMARALGQLIQLLQAEYKSSHTSPVDPKDPFANHDN
jgi:hypothetical protein